VLVPETVAVVDVKDVDTVQEYVHTEADDVALIGTSEAIPDKVIRGVGLIALEKVAVIVT